MNAPAKPAADDRCAKSGCGLTREWHRVSNYGGHAFAEPEPAATVVAREDYGPRVLCAHRFGNGARCSWTRDIHEASTREICDHQFTAPPTPAVVAREDRCREFVDQRIKSACARKSGHEGGHCIYDIDAACAASEPAPPTPDSSDDAAAWEIAERWYDKWELYNGPNTQEAIDGAVREALAAGEARGRRLEREACAQLAWGLCGEENEDSEEAIGAEAVAMAIEARKSP